MSTEGQESSEDQCPSHPGSRPVPVRPSRKVLGMPAVLSWLLLTSPNSPIAVCVHASVFAFVIFRNQHRNPTSSPCLPPTPGCSEASPSPVDPVTVSLLTCKRKSIPLWSFLEELQFPALPSKHKRKAPGSHFGFFHLVYLGHLWNTLRTTRSTGVQCAGAVCMHVFH
jgi:hypothetical protein